MSVYACVCVYVCVLFKDTGARCLDRWPDLCLGPRSRTVSKQEGRSNARRAHPDCSCVFALACTMNLVRNVSFALLLSVIRAHSLPLLLRKGPKIQGHEEQNKTHQQWFSVWWQEQQRESASAAQINFFSCSFCVPTARR